MEQIDYLSIVDDEMTTGKSRKQKKLLDAYAEELSVRRLRGRRYKFQFLNLVAGA